MSVTSNKRRFRWQGDAGFSRSWVQELDARGYLCELLSVDTSMDPYTELRSAYMENRVSAYSYSIAEGELGQLEEVYTGKIKDGKPVVKVDHPSTAGASKDVSDGMAGVAWKVMEHVRAGDAGLQSEVQVHGRKETEGEVGEKRKRLFEQGNFEELYELMKDEEEGW